MFDRVSADQHDRKHSVLHKPEVLCCYESARNACLAETLGIYFLKSVSDKFMEVLNVYWFRGGSREIIESCQARRHQYLHLLPVINGDSEIRTSPITVYCTSTPRQGPKRSIGLTKISNTRSAVENKGQVFCVHCQKRHNDTTFVATHKNQHGC